MPPSKYERELRFIDTEVARLNRSLQALVQTMPASPLEAAEKADQVLGFQQKIAELNERRRVIEQSFLDVGLDIPDIHRSMNATVHNAGAYEVVDEAEAEKLSGISPSKLTEDVKPTTLDGVTDEIRSVTDELSRVETQIVAAEIDGNDAELDKLRMMAGSLRSRRDSLVHTAKQMRAEQSSATKSAPAAADESTQKRIDDLESSQRALRSQVADVRSDMQDVKEQLRRILDALGVKQDDEPDQ